MRDSSTLQPILIVDDLAEQRLVTTHMLRKLPCPILTAQSGEQALALLYAHHPALAFVDIAMPGMNGLELLRIIRCDEHLCSTKVAIITAAPNLMLPTDVHLADRILAKPLDSQRLNQTVKDLLNW